MGFRRAYSGLEVRAPAAAVAVRVADPVGFPGSVDAASLRAQCERFEARAAAVCKATTTELRAARVLLSRAVGISHFPVSSRGRRSA